MNSDDIFKQKMQFLADTERRLRRKLTLIERKFMTRVFDNVMGQFQAAGALRDINNLTLIDGLGEVYRTAVSKDVADMVKDFGRSAMKTVEFAERYFRAESEGAPRLTDAVKEADRYLRHRLGIDKNGNLKPGGWMLSVVDDPSLVDGVRAAIYEAVDSGRDLQGIKDNVRRFVVEKKGSKAAIRKEFYKNIFDALQEADAAVNNRIRVELDYLAGRYQGGLIETSRVFCCERDGMIWTVEEIEEWDKLKWSGKKGNPKLFRGGYECRHQFQWVSTARALRLRPDLELKGGNLVLRKDAVLQAYRKGCEERLAAGMKARRERLKAGKAKRTAKATK